MGTQLQKKNDVLGQVKEKLTSLLKSNAAALPKSFNETRFLQNCLTVLNETKDIEACSPISIARTMVKGAYLGLDFFNGECYAIPFKGQLQFLTDYKGDIKLAKKYSINKIKDIYAKLVRKGDEFEVYVRDGRQYLNFTPKPFSNEEVVGAFAVAYFEDDTMIFDTMSIEEIEMTRKNFSKCPDSPAWKKSKGEMQKKTVLKRLCKMIELDFDTIEQAKAYQDSSDLDKEKLNAPTEKPKVTDPFTPEKAPESLPKPRTQKNGSSLDNQEESPTDAEFTEESGHSVSESDGEKEPTEEEIKKLWEEE